MPNASAFAFAARDQRVRAAAAVAPPPPTPAADARRRTPNPPRRPSRRTTRRNRRRIGVRGRVPAPRRGRVLELLPKTRQEQLRRGASLIKRRRRRSDRRDNKARKIADAEASAWRYQRYKTRQKVLEWARKGGRRYAGGGKKRHARGARRAMRKAGKEAERADEEGREGGSWGTRRTRTAASRRPRRGGGGGKYYCGRGTRGSSQARGGETIAKTKPTALERRRESQDAKHSTALTTTVSTDARASSSISRARGCRARRLAVEGNYYTGAPKSSARLGFLRAREGVSARGRATALAVALAPPALSRGTRSRPRARARPRRRADVRARDAPPGSVPSSSPPAARPGARPAAPRVSSRAPAYIGWRGPSNPSRLPDLRGCAHARSAD